MTAYRNTLLLITLLAVTGCSTVAPVAETPPAPAVSEAEAAAQAVEAPVPVPAAYPAPAPRPEPVDPWTTLRNGFRLFDTDHKPVHKAIRKYSRHPRDVVDIFERGSPYMTYILQEVQQRGFPAEIALLPFVESAFDPLAYSHGRASGLWQFIPGTARIYGLRQDWWHDERRDIIASTRAALDYLYWLHDRFEGDWLHALAAYNSGSGTVSNAIRRNRKAGKPTDFWHLRLPRETRSYVPRLLAISTIVSNPGKYGITLPPLSPEPAFAVVDTDGQLDIAVAAELAGVSTRTLYRLNPGLNRWTTHPDGPHRLLVPAERAASFSENLAALSDEQRARWVRHRIQPGQTLSHIAVRYDTTVTALRQVNNLTGNTIRVGRHLLVPVAARETTRYATVQRSLPRGKGSKTTYHVRDGDSLWVIARKHSVSVKQVAKWNGLGNRAVIRPGQQLVIWTQDTGSGDGLLRAINYTVRSGDSLYRIAQKFKVSIADLRLWNDLDADSYLQPGQQLTLYVDVTRVSQS